MSATPQTEVSRLADGIDSLIEWLKRRALFNVVDDVRKHQAELRRLDAENQQLRAKCNSYQNLVAALEGQRSVLQRDLQNRREAVTTLQSEREANAILTAENDQLRAQLALAVAAEREECAKVCESRYMGDNNREDMEAQRCAYAIRARGEAV